MKQNQLFDERRGENLKQRGMDLAADNARTALEMARDIARELCRFRGKVSADDVGRVLKARHGIDTLGPAAGSLFKGKEWEWTGEWIKSKRVTNHSRMLRVWRLK